MQFSTHRPLIPVPNDRPLYLCLIKTISFDPSTDLLISFDVESLYTSLPQDETIRIIEQVLFDSEWNFNTPRAFVLECIEVALTQNYFEFEGTIYLQTHGTSMGSTFAPSLAGLYVSNLEHEHILSATNPFRENIRVWKRYIDDIFVVWRGSERLARDFLVWLNHCNAFLKFTQEIGQSCLVFLDLNIYVDGNLLRTTTHTKATARNCLLRFDSFHPRHLRENLPFGQFLRLRRNCSNVRDFECQADSLTDKLVSRRYPLGVIKRARKRARNNNRDALLESIIKETGPPRLTCVTTYNAASNQVSKSINKHWRTLTSGALSFEKPLISYKRGRNIRDILVHTRPVKPKATSAPSSFFPSISGHYPCGSCRICHLTKVTHSIELRDGSPWALRDFTNCNTPNVVYLIECPCGLRYVGMTSRKVKLRIIEHCSTIRCKKDNTKMTSHFLELGHTPNDIRWTVIERTPSPHLLEREQRWVFRLGTHIRGLNDNIPWGQFI